MPLVDEMQPFSLATAKRGEIVEWFDEVVKQAIANALDENTDPKKTRKVTLEMSIHSNKERSGAVVGFSVRAKLEPDEGRTSTIYFGESMGKVHVVEHNPEQVDLFTKEEKGPRALEGDSHAG